MTQDQKATELSSAAQALTLPDFDELNAHIMKIATRSQKLINSFVSRNQTLSAKAKAADPGHLSKAFADFIKQTLSDPHILVEAQISFWQDYVRLLQNTLAQASGESVEPVITPGKGDKRFGDPGWEEIWVFNFIKQSYLLFARWMHTLIDHVEGIDQLEAHKVRFYASQMIDAMSPTNFWMTNPEVLRTTIETKGENLLKGLENLLADMEKGRGSLLITMSDHSAFQFGKNIAASKGKVVFQNELFQLLQFSPLTEQVFQTPLLIVPPWINKYYILDLKPESSYIRYMVEQGHTVFCISWVNPDARHAHLSFDDYMMLGPVTALREVQKITGEKRVNTMGYCIGGTLLASTLAWMAALGDKKPADLPEVASATYLTTMVDFSDVGDLAVFIDEEQISMLESMMNENGYLPGTTMAMTFSMLRANDLIWSFVVNNYLMGKEPFPFDMLTWNSDSTNLPAKMHSYYLRNMYLHNRLIVPNALSMKGVPIDLRKIKTPSFLLSTIEDHIAPWRTTYTATQIYSGPVTFCLSGSGHIAGAMNPPAKKKYGYWTNTQGFPKAPDEWLKNAEKHEGSWWPEWAKWISQHSGGKVAARDPAKTPGAIEDAPGSYVKGNLFG